jgi:hypothetical protein
MPENQAFQQHINKKSFYEDHIFHERHMNSCPIGCKGCAVSAKTVGKGAIDYHDLYKTYQEASELGVSMQITKVEGYDPAFVKYADDENISFAQSVKDAIDLGHTIITPICTTGSWKSEQTQWQIDELGKLEPKYREYTYPSGKKGDAFVLSVPREINPFAKNYDFNDHLVKVVRDIEALTKNGKLEVLIYYNSKLPEDIKTARAIKDELTNALSESAKKNADLLITDFNSETLPESCYRYDNSVLLSDKGFAHIDPVTMDWQV